MGTVILVEYPEYANGQDGAQVPDLAKYLQKVTSSTSSAQSAVLQGSTGIVKIVPSVSVYVAWGADPTATTTAGANKDYAPAGVATFILGKLMHIENPFQGIMSYLIRL